MSDHVKAPSQVSEEILGNIPDKQLKNLFKVQLQKNKAVFLLCFALSLESAALADGEIYKV